MAVTTREQIATALFALVSTEVGTVVNLVTSSRRPRAATDVSPAEMPALFMEELEEEYERTQGKLIGLPPRRTMLYDLGLYTSDPQESSVVAMTQLNSMIDAVERAFEPDPTTGIQTLGGIVASARIDGKIRKAYNLNGDGKSIAIIPIAVIRP